MTNSVTLDATIVRDPELRTVGQNQSQLCTFAVAWNEKPRPGEKYGKGHFFDVKAWKGTAEAAAAFTKGQRVHVEGMLTQESWDDKETGKKRSKTVIVAFKVEALQDTRGLRKAVEEEEKTLPKAKGKPEPLNYSSPGEDPDESLPF